MFILRKLYGSGKMLPQNDIFDPQHFSTLTNKDQLQPFKRNRRLYYFTGFIFLLVLEVLIAARVQDDFVRPYLGDYLVVILLYCLLMAAIRFSVLQGLIAVLIFSFSVEFFQLINIVKVLQYQPPKMIMIVLGSSFSIWDLLAYSLGLVTCLLIELYRNRIISRQRNSVNT